MVLLFYSFNTDDLNYHFGRRAKRKARLKKLMELLKNIAL